MKRRVEVGGGRKTSKGKRLFLWVFFVAQPFSKDPTRSNKSSGGRRFFG